jgi:hypothetical protein
MNTESQPINEWALSKLEPLKENPCVLLRDPLHLLPDVDGVIHSFARDNGFTAIVAATNLVFRELYERALSDAQTKKLLVIDRTPAKRVVSPAITTAPPLFYPDLLSQATAESRIDLIFASTSGKQPEIPTGRWKPTIPVTLGSSWVI